MSMLRWLALSIWVLGAGSEVSAGGQHYRSRQYYSGWSQYHGTNTDYYYRSYYYKPSEDYCGYQHHYVFYYPADPDYCYYYNPYKQVYWGRCSSHGDGQEHYSLLAESDRHGNLDQIPPSAFPTAGAMPPVPGTNPQEGLKMDLPPDDLPSTRSFPKNVQGIPSGQR